MRATLALCHLVQQFPAFDRSPLLLYIAAAGEQLDDDIEIEGGPQLAPNVRCPISNKPVGCCCICRVVYCLLGSAWLLCPSVGCPISNKSVGGYWLLTVRLHTRPAWVCMGAGATHREGGGCSGGGGRVSVFVRTGGSQD